MNRKFYDLEYSDGRRFSPYCWRTRFALAHKGLEAESVPVRMTDKETIAFSGSKTVPVLVDGENVVPDSWAIAEYLERAYPDAPSLFGGDVGRATCRFVNTWCDTQLLRGLFYVIGPDLLAFFLPEDLEYFVRTREKRLGTPFEDMKTEREAREAALWNTLAPLRLLLSKQPYIGGEAPAYGDIIVGATLQWARCSSPIPTIRQDDTPVYEWFQRMLDAYGGIARAMPAHPEAE